MDPSQDEACDLRFEDLPEGEPARRVVATPIERASAVDLPESEAANDTDRGEAKGTAAAAALAGDHPVGDGGASVIFHNRYSQKMFIAYKFRDWSCENECAGIWRANGWLNLDPGESKSRPNPTLNRWFYYYAGIGSAHTQGGVSPTFVETEKFTRCTCFTPSSTSPFHVVEMAEIDTRFFAGVEVTVE